MSPYAILSMLGVAGGIIIGAYMLGKADEREDWEQAAKDQVIKQAAHDAKIIGDFHANLNALRDHYKRNPVRVRVPSTCPDDPSAGPVVIEAKDIILTVGGINGSHGRAVLK